MSGMRGWESEFLSAAVLERQKLHRGSALHIRDVPAQPEGLATRGRLHPPHLRTRLREWAIRSDGTRCFGIVCLRDDGVQSRYEICAMSDWIIVFANSKANGDLAATED